MLKRIAFLLQHRMSQTERQVCRFPLTFFFSSKPFEPLLGPDQVSKSPPPWMLGRTGIQQVLFQAKLQDWS